MSRKKQHILYFLAFVFFAFSCKTIKNEAPEKKESDEYKEAQMRLMYHDALKFKLKGDREGATHVLTAILDKSGDNSAVFYELSKIHDSKGSFLKALEAGERAMMMEPENKWYLRWMAILYKKNSYYEKAAFAFEALLEEDPKNMDYLIAWSEVLYLSGQIEKTIQAYVRLEEVYGKEPELIIRRYQLYMDVKQYENAVEDLKTLIKIEPDNGQYYQLLAETYEIMGENEKANDIYEELSQMEGAGTKIALVMAQRHFDQGEDKKALDALIKVYRDEMVDIDTKVQLLLTLYDMSASENAFLREKIKELLDILVEVHPEDPKSYSVYGDYYLQQEDYQNARLQFMKALELDDSRFPIWNQVLLLSYELNEFEDMFIYGNKALELFPSQPVLYLYKGIGALNTSRNEEAINSLEYGKDLVFENNELKAEFYQNIGTAYYRNKDFIVAFKKFDKSLELNPKNAFLLNNYSYYLTLRNENLDKAEEMAKKANQLLPNQPSFQDTYGWVFFKKGDFKNALVWIEKAAKGNEESATILEHYGDVLFHIGKIEEAIEQWEKAKNTGGASELIDKKIEDKKYH